jgi:hypothetical protein
MIKGEALFLLEACERNECTGVKFLRYSLKGDKISEILPVNRYGMAFVVFLTQPAILF